MNWAAEQSDEVACPGSHSWQAAGPGLAPRQQLLQVVAGAAASPTIASMWIFIDIITLLLQQHRVKELVTQRDGG